jgi:low temperature requirement protein LtrA
VVAFALSEAAGDLIFVFAMNPTAATLCHSERNRNFATRSFCIVELWKAITIWLALPHNPWYNNQTVESSVASRIIKCISRSESGI